MQKAKYYAILLVICLMPLAAASQALHSVGELHQQAACRWHKTYQAHGRTIKVNIDIQVPDVEALPVLLARPHAPSPLIPQNEGDGIFEFEVDDSLIYQNQPGSFTWIYGDKDHRRRIDKLSMGISGYSSEVMRISPSEVDWDMPYAQKNPATLRYLDGELRAQYHRWFPESQIELALETVEASIDYRPYDVFTDTFSGQGKADHEGDIQAEYRQLLHGVPILGYALRTFQLFGGDLPNEDRMPSAPNAGALIYSKWFAQLGEEGLSESVHLHLLEELAVLQEDVPLCPMQRVLATYESLIEEGKLRWVGGLRLGYIGWYERGEPLTLRLVPVWVLDGVLHPTAASRDPMSKYLSAANPAHLSSFHGNVLVNAQTGELINPWRTDPERCYDPPRYVNTP